MFREKLSFHDGLRNDSQNVSHMSDNNFEQSHAPSLRELAQKYLEEPDFGVDGKPWVKINSGMVGNVHFEERAFSCKMEFYAYIYNKLKNGCPCRGFDKLDGQLQTKCKDRNFDYRTNTSKWLNRHFLELKRIEKLNQESILPLFEFFICPCGIAHK